MIRDNGALKYVLIPPFCAKERLEPTPMLRRGRIWEIKKVLLW